MSENIAQYYVYVFESGHYGVDVVNNAFDSNIATMWEGTADNSWICVDFGVGGSAKVHTLRLKPRAYSGNAECKDFIFYGSNNSTNGSDGTWTQIASGQHGNNENFEDFTVDDTNSYRLFKVLVDTSWRGDFAGGAFYEVEMLSDVYEGIEKFVAKTFSYTGAVQTTTLLAGKRYRFECWGAQGRSRDATHVGGYGGYASGELTFSVDTTANIYVGQMPTGTTGGWNGGGNGSGRGGGGASDIRIGGTALANRVIVAGGGGGGGQNGNGDQGRCAGLTGFAGNDYAYGAGGGASQTAGGTPNGTLGQGGNATVTGSGGGGGGYYGGGGTTSGSGFGGGGGGSGYVGGVENGFMTKIKQTGNGVIRITEIEPLPVTLTVPTTYQYTGNPTGLYLKKGSYKFELFGAQGGISGTSKIGGYGGYCSGELTFLTDTQVALCIGKQGGVSDGGWNGGGSWYSSTTNAVSTGGGGGGATDVRIGGGLNEHRVLVAGGGGGQSTQNTTNGSQGAGGGLSGSRGTDFGTANAGNGGTQSAGGSGSGSGGLGAGGSGYGVQSGAGGGGYYGGGAGLDYDGGGGGSSYYGTAINPLTSTGINDGDGYIIITPLTVATKRFAQII